MDGDVDGCNVGYDDDEEFRWWEWKKVVDDDVSSGLIVYFEILSSFKVSLDSFGSLVVSVCNIRS